MVEIDPTSLPQLSKQLRDQKNKQKQKKVVFLVVLLVFTSFTTLRWLIIVPGGLITSPPGGPGGPGTGFCSPGGGFFSFSPS